MITIWGGGGSRSLRVTWLLEEMGLDYRLRGVNLLKDDLDPEFLAANPAGYIPTLQDGETTMVESIAIMQYLTARYGPTSLAPAPTDPAFPAYLQFLHLGEAGLATPLHIVVMSLQFAPEADRQNWGADRAQEIFDSRRQLMARQLARFPYLAGEAFTAADISVTYVLTWGPKYGGVTLSDAEQAYVGRTTGRDAYKRAVEKSEAAAAAAP